jgi:hypothetical protein
MREHHHAIAPVDVLARQQGPATSALTPNVAKKSAATYAVLSPQWLAAIHQRETGGKRAIGRYVVEGAAKPPPVLEVRNRDRASRLVASRVGEPQPDESLRRSERQLAEQDAPHHAEDRGGRADAQRKRQDDDDGEARGASCGTRRIAEILPELVEKMESVRITDLFLVPLHAAKGAQRRRAGTLLTHAARDVLGRLSLDVKAELVVEIASHAASKHERPEAQHDALNPNHGPSTASQCAPRRPGMPCRMSTREMPSAPVECQGERLCTRSMRLGFRG